MTRTIGAAIGFLLVVFFLTAVAVQSMRAASLPSVVAGSAR